MYVIRFILSGAADKNSPARIRQQRHSGAAAMPEVREVLDDGAGNEAEQHEVGERVGEAQSRSRILQEQRSGEPSRHGFIEVKLRLKE